MKNLQSMRPVCSRYWPTFPATCARRWICWASSGSCPIRRDIASWKCLLMSSPPSSADANSSSNKASWDGPHADSDPCNSWFMGQWWAKGCPTKFLEICYFSLNFPKPNNTPTSLVCIFHILIDHDLSWKILMVIETVFHDFSWYDIMIIHDVVWQGLRKLRFFNLRNFSFPDCLPIFKIRWWYIVIQNTKVLKNHLHTAFRKKKSYVMLHNIMSLYQI